METKDIIFALKTLVDELETHMYRHNGALCVMALTIEIGDREKISLIVGAESVESLEE